MRQLRPLILSFLATLLLLPGDSAAQGTRFSIGLMAGFGATTGTEPPPGSAASTAFLSQDDFELGTQLVFSMEIGPKRLFGVRLGQLGVGIAAPGPLQTVLIDSELTYLTLGGEYRITEGYYESGLFIGLGYYGIDGKNQVEDDSALGLNFGVTGDFRINDRWSVLVEFAVHYADMEYAQLFFMGHTGLAFRF